MRAHIHRATKFGCVRACKRS